MRSTACLAAGGFIVGQLDGLFWMAAAAAATTSSQLGVHTEFEVRLSACSRVGLTASVAAVIMGGMATLPLPSSAPHPGTPPGPPDLLATSAGEWGGECTHSSE